LVGSVASPPNAAAKPVSRRERYQAEWRAQQAAKQAGATEGLDLQALIRAASAKKISPEIQPRGKRPVTERQSSSHIAASRRLAESRT
jgi:hypothetical protein